MWIDDVVLEQSHNNLYLSLWRPEKPIVVVGSGNDESKECQLQRCKKDNLPVYRRYGGGGAVVLHQGCIIISLGVWVRHMYQNDRYFSKINEAIIKTLSLVSPTFGGVYQDGLSDLVYAGKKIMGSSMFRSRHYLLFQGSILFDSKVEIISSYLEHPSKEPEYRKGKAHQDFLTCLKDISPGVTYEQVNNVFHNSFENLLRAELKDLVIAPCKNQIENLEKRRKQNKGILLN